MLGDRSGRRCRRRAAEQAVRLDGKHDRHHHEFRHERELGKGDRESGDLDLAEADAEGFHEPDDERCDERARDRAQPADHRDDERLRDYRKVHPEIGRLARQLQRAGEPGERRAEEEDAREQPRLIDAERLRHHPVLSRRAHQHAPTRSPGEPPQQQENGGSDDDQQRVVLREHAARDLDRTLEAGCARPEQIFRSPERKRRVLDDQHDAEGGDQLQQLGRGVESPQQQDLHQRADRADGDRRGEHRKPITGNRRPKAGDRAVRDVRAEHVERPVREVDDARHPEDEREPGRDEEQRRRAGEAVDELDEEGGEGQAALTMRRNAGDPRSSAATGFSFDRGEPVVARLHRRSRRGRTHRSRPLRESPHRLDPPGRGWATTIARGGQLPPARIRRSDRSGVSEA